MKKTIEWPSTAIVDFLQREQIRVYVAGPYSPTGNDPTTFLSNIRKGVRMSARLLMLGYMPFCPFFDFLLWFTLRGKEKISVLQIRAYSLTWLRCCQAMLLLPGWQHSTGCQGEIAEAHRLGIPIFYSLKDLRKYFEKDMTSTKRTKSKRS